MHNNSKLIQEMVTYYAGDPQQIQHLLKVYSFASLIADCEEIDEETRFILETAAIVHDIGIRMSREVYGDSNGKHQEELGPDAARPMLAKLSYDPPIVDRVCELIGRHHTYTNIDGLDCQILIEADFLVNLFEEHISKEGIASALKNIFRTHTGIMLCKQMFNIEDPVPDEE